jgi:hypothetical protein
MRGITSSVVSGAPPTVGSRVFKVPTSLVGKSEESAAGVAAGATSDTGLEAGVSVPVAGAGVTSAVLEAGVGSGDSEGDVWAKPTPVVRRNIRGVHRIDAQSSNEARSHATIFFRNRSEISLFICEFKK